MLKKLMVALVLAASIIWFAPASAKAENLENGTSKILSSKIELASAQVRGRYVRVRGKRYYARYRIFYRGGRRYIRIVSLRRA